MNVSCLCCFSCASYYCISSFHFYIMENLDGHSLLLLSMGNACCLCTTWNAFISWPKHEPYRVRPFSSNFSAFSGILYFKLNKALRYDRSCTHECGYFDNCRCVYVYRLDTNTNFLGSETEHLGRKKCLPGWRLSLTLDVTCILQRTWTHRFWLQNWNVHRYQLGSTSQICG